MHIKSLILIISCTACLLSGCAAKPSIHDSGTQSNGMRIFTSSQDRTLDLLAFCETYSNLTPEAQKKAFASTNQALATNKNDLSQRIKLAIMLALPSSRLRDTVKAQNLLQDLLQENSLSASDADFVGLLYEYTVFSNKQLQRDREDAKKHELLQQKYDALIQKNEALEQKLNDLKNIEKTMNERSSKADSKP
jgi:hypothetical protein